ncbi:hypothetical protein E6Q11_02245 [Candidatus Dojkabacteria bacterium]|uniref:Tail assembly protein n=1 Tax=Candidatus Dojkabacteria bacterium TaxID=2099670 RepID=A0A5C7JB75_9BACT|nr:MAG: hypothetical protein E6Q11_02245 [Candidatus Dojkabacteria bacterium]
MKIIFHGKFAEDYGKEHYIEAASIVEAIRGLTEQLRFYGDKTIDKRPAAAILGHNTIESLLECPDEIHVVPAISGGKGIGKILIGAALIAVAIVAAPMLGPQISGILISMGVSMIISGITDLFIKAPSLSKETDPDASKYLGLSGNTVKLGTLRSYSMGRIRLTASHLLALNVDSNDLVRGEFPV